MNITLTRVLIKQLCLTVLNEYVLPSTMEWEALNKYNMYYVNVLYLDNFS
jgi:hypothetical protein